MFVAVVSHNLLGHLPIPWGGESITQSKSTEPLTRIHTDVRKAPAERREVPHQYTVGHGRPWVAIFQRLTDTPQSMGHTAANFLFLMSVHPLWLRAIASIRSTHD